MKRTLWNYLKGFFTPVSKLRVFFNTSEDPHWVKCHARIWDQRYQYDDVNHDVAVILNHPAVLVSCRKKHLEKIFQAAKDCGIESVSMRVGNKFYDAVYPKKMINDVPFEHLGVKV